MLFWLTLHSRSDRMSALSVADSQSREISMHRTRLTIGLLSFFSSVAAFSASAHAQYSGPINNCLNGASRECADAEDPSACFYMYVAVNCNGNGSDDTRNPGESPGPFYPTPAPGSDGAVYCTGRIDCPTGPRELPRAE